MGTIADYWIFNDYKATNQWLTKCYRVMQMLLSLLLIKKKTKKPSTVCFEAELSAVFPLTSVDGDGETLRWGDSEGSEQRADADVDEDVGRTEPRWETKHENCAQNQHHRHEGQETCGMKTHNSQSWTQTHTLTHREYLGERK